MKLLQQKQMPVKWKMFTSEDCIRGNNYVQPTTLSRQRLFHVQPFNDRHHEKAIELLKEFWRLKDRNFTPTVTWKIKGEFLPFNLETN